VIPDINFSSNLLMAMKSNKQA